MTNAAYHDESRRTHTFSIGDLDVCRKLARKPGMSPKLNKMYYYGPYQIISLLTDVTAIIESLDTRKLREKVHVEKLKRYFSRDVPNEGADVEQCSDDDSPTEPIIIDADEEPCSDDDSPAAPFTREEASVDTPPLPTSQPLHLPTNQSPSTDAQSDLNHHPNPLHTTPQQLRLLLFLFQNYLRYL